MKRIYSNFLNQEKLREPPVERLRIHLILCWIHSIIMERIKYIPIGWSKAYEFSEADLRCAFELINLYID